MFNLNDLKWDKEEGTICPNKAKDSNLLRKYKLHRMLWTIFFLVSNFAYAAVACYLGELKGNHHDGYYDFLEVVAVIFAMKMFFNLLFGGMYICKFKIRYKKTKALKQYVHLADVEAVFDKEKEEAYDLRHDICIIRGFENQRGFAYHPIRTKIQSYEEHKARKDPVKINFYNPFSKEDLQDHGDWENNPQIARLALKR